MRTHFKERADAVWVGSEDGICGPRRQYVPTVYGQPTGNTQWVSNLAEFRAAGGTLGFNEDQTEITLCLPVGFKFSCQFDWGKP